MLCLDNDGQNSHSDRLIHFAAEKLQDQGKAVWIAQPKIEGWDYNDMLMHQGLAAVKKGITASRLLFRLSGSILSRV